MGSAQRDGCKPMGCTHVVMLVAAATAAAAAAAAFMICRMVCTSITCKHDARRRTIQSLKFFFFFGFTHHHVARFICRAHCLTLFNLRPSRWSLKAVAGSFRDGTSAGGGFRGACEWSRVRLFACSHSCCRPQAAHDAAASANHIADIQVSAFQFTSIMR